MPNDKNIIEPIDASFDDVTKALAPRLKSPVNSGLPIAKYAGTLTIGEAEIGCAVLDDGTRLLTQSDMMRALGRARQAKGRGFYDADVNLPAFLTAKNIKEFIPNDLYVTSSQIEFFMPNGQKAFGYKAELLPQVCDVYLEARDAGALVQSQLHIARQAEILVRSLAKVGIVALVDEATGYQRDRGHDALRMLLEKYISEGLQKWIHTFPDPFFAELDRLYDNAPTTSRSRPQYYGRFINKYVYDPIEHGYVKAKLNELNITDDGKRRARFHQWLNDDGRTILTRQIGKVEGIMEMCDDIEHFKRVARRQKSISVAPYLFDEMNKIID
ncbi:P63C domain-containing protein [Novosphingobium mangrovi (ex Hu et al. 2023)]|uniref:P63C domain-containing protein n=1 Tax=Novosphingobium mangrovi (ex Hu et al. 2023) TaxID=2930094 RepID=A0ABT0AG49_9SPHN|nr:P63C domain-containing protein [Novosphingobium mangrovi (ex Hu et al. 2023)]MCJ1962188.1 P63C domain-containing protein [Novosphingobium mangrovi (ex Hu et al. 2023)]